MKFDSKKGDACCKDLCSIPKFNLNDGLFL